MIPNRLIRFTLFRGGIITNSASFFYVLPLTPYPPLPQAGEGKHITPTPTSYPVQGGEHITPPLPLPIQGGEHITPPLNPLPVQRGKPFTPTPNPLPVQRGKPFTPTPNPSPSREGHILFHNIPSGEDPCSIV